MVLMAPKGETKNPTTDVAVAWTRCPKRRIPTAMARPALAAPPMPLAIPLRMNCGIWLAAFLANAFAPALNPDSLEPFPEPPCPWLWLCPVACPGPCADPVFGVGAAAPCGDDVGMPACPPVPCAPAGVPEAPAPAGVGVGMEGCGVCPAPVGAGMGDGPAVPAVFPCVPFPVALLPAEPPVDAFPPAFFPPPFPPLGMDGAGGMPPVAPVPVPVPGVVPLAPVAAVPLAPIGCMGWTGAAGPVPSGVDPATCPAGAGVFTSVSPADDGAVLPSWSRT